MTGVDEFIALYQSHYPRLVSALAIAGTDYASAQDLAQEAFARTFGHWSRVRKGTNPTGYVYTVAFREMRRRARGVTFELSEDDHVVPGPEDGAVQTLTFLEALDAMPTRRRACAALCLYLGFAPEHAAHVLGVQASTVRVQLHRARAELARALGDTEPLDSMVAVPQNVRLRRPASLTAP